MVLNSHFCFQACYLQTCIAYICRLTPKLGKLDLAKCVEKNVPCGPLLGKLKAGEDITLKDGTIVKAKDVKDPDLPGPVFIGKVCVALRYGIVLRISR